MSGIYVASKTVHADKWKQFREGGAPIISTWIDEAGEGDSPDYADLAQRCIEEAAGAAVLVLYCEPGEVLKGALLEVGAALATNTPVLAVGDCGSLSRVFKKHPKWHEYDSLLKAMRDAEEACRVLNLVTKGGC